MLRNVRTFPSKSPNSPISSDDPMTLNGSGVSISLSRMVLESEDASQEGEKISGPHDMLKRGMMDGKRSLTGTLGANGLFLSAFPTARGLVVESAFAFVDKIVSDSTCLGSKMGWELCSCDMYRDLREQSHTARDNPNKCLTRKINDSRV